MIFLIYERNNIVGNGHYMRCKNLHAWLEEKHPGCSTLQQENEFIFPGTTKDIYILDLFTTGKTNLLIPQLSKDNLVATFDYFSNEQQPDLNVSVFEQFHSPRDHKNYTGLKYSIIRSEFLKQDIVDPKPDTIFVYIGGTGYTDIIDEISVKLGAMPFSITLVRNNHSEPLNELPANFKVYTEPENLTELMNNSYMAVTSPGLTTMELLYLQVPSVLYPLNGLHDKFSAYFIENHLALDTFRNFNRVNRQQVELVKRTGAAVIDGKGTDRILNLIMQEYEQKMGRSFTVWQ